MLYISGYQLDILFNCVDVEGFLLIDFLKGSASDNLHLMDFEDVEIQVGDECSLTDALLSIFTRKPQDDVPTRENAALMGLGDGLAGLLEGVASVDELERAVVGTLNAIFDHEESLLIEAAQVVEQFGGYAVGARPYHDAYDIIHAQRLFIERLEMGEGSVGVGVGLEVGEILHVGVFAGKELLALLQLLADAVAMVAVGGIEGAVVAEDAPASGNAAVAVGACEPSIHRNLLDAEGETAANPGAIIVIIGSIHFI